MLILGCATTASRFRPAKVASKRALDYPLSAQLDKIEGEVVVGVFVDTEGNPEDVKVLESSGYAVLDSAAYQFAQTIAFDPAVVDGEKISSWTKLLLRYKLTEVPFAKDKWVEDVQHFQDKISNASDAAEEKLYQRKLFMRYVGLTSYIDRYRDVAINDMIQRVVTERSNDRWQEFTSEIVAPFMVFDDFLYRYPNSELAQNAKENLIRLLIDAEADIRIRSLKSKRISPKYAELLNTINQRLDDLQRLDYNKMMQSLQ
jgi:TonB family protein